MKKTIILNTKQINHKIRRIAYQIYENNVNEKEIIIAGIEKNGYIFAQKIKRDLEKISTLKVTLCNVIINKRNPIDKIATDLKTNSYIGYSLVLVDDVLNSGATLIYAIKHFLNVPLKQFKTAVLVNRNHKKFPVKADFKGISLSTSLQEHIVVEFNTSNSVAYLN